MSVRLGCRFYLFLCVCIFLIVLECLAVSYTHLAVKGGLDSVMGYFATDGDENDLKNNYCR